MPDSEPAKPGERREVTVKHDLLDWAKISVIVIGNLCAVVAFAFVLRNDVDYLKSDIRDLKADLRRFADVSAQMTGVNKLVEVLADRVDNIATRVTNLEADERAKGSK